MAQPLARTACRLWSRSRGTPAAPSLAGRRWQSSWSHLEPEMTARKIRPIFDDMTPQYSFRLDTALADFLPDTRPPRILPAATANLPLPIPHHLLYFEPTKAPSELLPDGTNPDQSPGDPFVRRMWAGGTVLYNNSNPMHMDNSRAVCVEGIRDVAVKGKPGDEKVFVGIERRIAGLSMDEHAELRTVGTDTSRIDALEEKIRSRLWQGKDTDFGPCSIIERRNIVFMRERSPEEIQAATAASRKPGKMLRPQHAPDYTHTLVPNAQLLFRFSALTFNAHAIHLDPHYCRTVEGHRDLLFHGPLSFTMLVTLLQQRLEGTGERIGFVEYRNLAPLYANEPLKLCGRKEAERKYEIWAETPEGGVAVKGTVKTEVV